MGQTTDAILWWGYNDDSEQENQIPECVIEHLREHPIDHLKFRVARGEDLENVLEDLENILYYVLPDFGVELVRHCSGECTMYGLAVTASKVKAHRGYPKQIEILKPTEEWHVILKRAADLLGWPTDSKKPAWWLASYFG